MTFFFLNNILCLETQFSYPTVNDVYMFAWLLQPNCQIFEVQKEIPKCRTLSPPEEGCSKSEANP